ncbi:hypothetical protein BKP42_20620 [Rhodococcus erythropolis]|nr:hypothetical protein BKP42_20620 [Rhodococcus erythropolis]
MVNDQNKNVLPPRGSQKRDPHGDLSGDVEPAADHFADHRDWVTDIHRFEIDRHLVENALVRPLLRIRIVSSQHLVPVDDVADRLVQNLDVQVARQRECCRNVVCPGFRIETVEEPHSLLGR